MTHNKLPLQAPTDAPHPSPVRRRPARAAGLCGALCAALLLACQPAPPRAKPRDPTTPGAQDHPDTPKNGPGSPQGRPGGAQHRPGSAQDRLDGGVGAGLRPPPPGPGARSDSASLPGPAADPAAGVTLRNRAAYLPPQCYTKTETAPGRPAANPCFTCHVQARAPNFVDDADLQQEYSFAEYALENRWANLFEDRSAAVAKISDAEITGYIRRSNYFDERGGLALRAALSPPKASWDLDRDGRWGGYLPDAYFSFDREGFDRDPQGGYTGWRAYAYYPTPGTFWPTNGSTSDALIRLPAVFRRTAQGHPSQEVYRLNLAILEALFRRGSVPIPATEEARFGVDLNRNRRLDTATEVVFDWAPLRGRHMQYVGAAQRAQAAGEVHLAAGLFPEGTELLHTVRYVDLAEDGAARLSARLKELRYAKKTSWQSYAQLEAAAADETKDKHDFPDRLKDVWGTGDAERGIANGRGWRLQGFIEDAHGGLRPQSFEEHVYCVGCHGGLGTTHDSMFSFARKLPPSAPAGGWFHWSQRNLKGIGEPRRADGQGEYSLYLAQNRAGDEFRTNQEVITRFFDDHGALRPGPLARLKTDVTALLWPSKARALRLNKAYRVIVRDQDFIDGRDATVRPPQQLHRRLKPEETTGVQRPVPPNWRPAPTPQATRPPRSGRAHRTAG